MSAILHAIIETVSSGGPSLLTPTNLIVIINVEGVSMQVSWSDVTGETGYELQRRIDGGAWTTFSLGADVTSYVDTNNHTAGQVYDYRIRAVGSGIGSSPWSSIVSRAVPVPIDAPSLTATYDSANITINLNWNDVSNETNYEISINGNTPVAPYPSANVTSYTYYGPFFSNFTYEYRIRGVNTNTGYTGPYSNTASVTTSTLNYSQTYVGSNSYITFGGGSTQYSGLGPDGPPLPKIMISASDNSYQRVYTLTTGTTPNRFFRVRFEGTASTGGSVGFPNMVWEAVFSEAIPNRIDLHIGDNARSPFGVSGVFSNNALIANFPNGSVNTAYRIETTSGAATVTPITLALNGTTGMNIIHEGSRDDSYTASTVGIPFSIQYLGTTY